MPLLMLAQEREKTREKRGRKATSKNKFGSSNEQKMAFPFTKWGKKEKRKCKSEEINKEDKEQG